MNLKEIEFVFQTFLKPEFDLIDLSDPIISTINIAKSLKKFYNISNIYMLRNFVSNFKKIIESSPELNPDDPYLNLIMKSLIVEILYGKQQEIKGSLKSIMSAVSEKQENIKKKFCQIYSQFSNEIITENYERFSKSYDFNFDKESICIKIFNHIIDIYEFFHCPIEPLLIKKLLKYHLIFLTHLKKILGFRQLYLLKHLELLRDEMRNIYITFTNFFQKDFFSITHHEEEFDSLLKKLIEFYSFSNIISKDVLSQISVLLIFFDLNIKKNSLDKVLSDNFGGLTEEDSESEIVIILSKIRGIVLLHKTPKIHTYKVLDGRETLLTYIINICCKSSQYVKSYSFRTLLEVFNNLKSDIQASQDLIADENLPEWIFDCFVKNWESSMKGISQIIENTLNCFLKIYGQNRKFIIKFIHATLNINSSTNKRKYNILTIISEYLEPDWLVKNYKNIIQELLCYSGDQYTTSALTFMQSILERLYSLQEKNIDLWKNYWINEYILALEKENHLVVKGVINNLTPILAKIDKNSIIILIREFEKKKLLKKKNFLWAYVSLIKLAREKSLIKFVEDQFFIEEILIPKKRIENLLFNSDRYICLEVLQFLTYSKKITDVPTDSEFSLISKFFEKNVRTSHPDFRVNMIVIYKKFFFRLRAIFENEFTYEKDKKIADIKEITKKSKKPSKIHKLKEFISSLFRIMNLYIYPDCPFELISPIFDIMRLLFELFGVDDFLYKKNIEYKGITLLSELNIYTQDLYDYLILSLRTSYEAVRKQSYQMLLLFPNDLPFLTLQKIKFQFEKALLSSKNLVIRVYESSGYLMSILLAKHLPMLKGLVASSINNKNYNEKHGDIFEYLISNLEDGFTLFQENFLYDWDKFYSNTPHGMLTVISTVIQILFGEENRSVDFIQSLQNSEIIQKQYYNLLVRIMKVLEKIMMFATKISAENVSISVFDNSLVKEKLIKEKKIKFDCRGHPILEENDKKEFIKHIEQLLSSNTLMDSFGEKAGQSVDDLENENTLVVSFYLLTREAGLLFQAVSQIIHFCEKNDLKQLIDALELETLAKVCFESLLSVKHLGSIERIASGITKLCVTIYDSKEPIIPNLAEKLAVEVMDHLEKNQFTNSLRRSAGLPPAIVCLLNSEIAGRKTKLLPTIMEKLFSLFETPLNEDNVIIKVHSLNILKLIYEDSSLKRDVEKYLGEGFQLAIKGFSINDWGIRNSSLMLFSSLTKRTFGTNKTADQNSVKNQMNIIEFFTRAPQLMDFFFKEINDFLKENAYHNVMYPPLYPIALIFSKLLPYDFKNNFLTMDEEEMGEEDIKREKKFINLPEVEKFLPLLIECGNNKNYMGRLMVARSIQAFMSFENITSNLKLLINHNILQSSNHIKKNHNFAHGILIQTYNVLCNYLKIREEINIANENFDAFQKEILKELLLKVFILKEINCPLVVLVYIDLMRKMQFCLNEENIKTNQEKFKDIYDFSYKLLEDSLLNLKNLRYNPDLGHSVLRKGLIKFCIEYDAKFSYECLDNSCLTIEKFCLIFQRLYLKNLVSFQTFDHEVFKLILQKINKTMEKNLKIFSMKTIDLIKEMILNFLDNPSSNLDQFNHCNMILIKILTRILINYQENNFLLFGQAESLWNQLINMKIKFQKNSPLMKKTIKLMGVLLGKTLFTSSNIDKFTGKDDKLFILQQFENIIWEYSNSNEKDFLRISVIKSLKFSLPQIFELLKANNYGLLLSYSKTFIRLLQDEIPEIRQKMGNFLSKLLGTYLNKSSTEEYTFNFNFVLEKYISFLIELFVNNSGIYSLKENLEKLIEFLVIMIFESEFFIFKKRNYFDKRIFSFDKTNKFHDDVCLKNFAFSHIKTINQFLQKNSNIQNGEMNVGKFMESYAKEKKFSFLEFSLKSLNDYRESYMERSEYTFENMTNYVYYHLIQKIFCKNKYTPCEEDEKILENMNENKTCLNFNIQQLISEFFLS